MPFLRAWLEDDEVHVSETYETFEEAVEDFQGTWGEEEEFDETDPFVTPIIGKHVAVHGHWVKDGFAEFLIEVLTDDELEVHTIDVDNGDGKYYFFVTAQEWGDMMERMIGNGVSCFEWEDCLSSHVESEDESESEEEPVVTA